MPAKIIPVGTVFGKLKIIGPAASRKGRGFTLCQCKCGRQIEIRNDGIKTGHATSCGCYMREKASETAVKNHTTHGFASIKNRHLIYQTWTGIIGRCENPKNQDWLRYGGRGIKMCPRWRGSFKAFIDDMGERPPKMTIDRKDNNGDYCKDNCHWATQRDQTRNTSRTRTVTVLGFTGCIADVANHFKIDPYVVYGRLKKGWNAEVAFTTPAHQKPSLIKA